MGFIQNLLSIFQKNKTEEIDTVAQKSESKNERKDIFQGNIYDYFETPKPFTVLENEQFRSFVADLSHEKDLSPNAREAFGALWRCACIDIDGYGNNIWDLKEGQFVVYDEDGVKIQFKKKLTKDILNGYTDELYDQGRADLTYTSPDGGILISQDKRNRRLFLVYTSDDITEKFMEILRKIELQAIGLKETKENIHKKYAVDISKMNQIPQQSSERKQPPEDLEL